MDRPPRDLKRDRLINGPLLRYSYLIAGVMTVRPSRVGSLPRCCCCWVSVVFVRAGAMSSYCYPSVCH